MKRLIAATEFQHGRGNNKYYKIYVQRPDGRMLLGTRSLDRGTYDTFAERQNR